MNLSKSALAVLRFRAKQWRTKVRENNLGAFRELVDAGIMAPDGEAFLLGRGSTRHRRRDHADHRQPGRRRDLSLRLFPGLKPRHEHGTF